MFAIVNVAYFFLYGGGFALMKVTKAATSVACPWPYPGGQGLRPAGLLRGGRASPARTSPASGPGGRAASPTAGPTSTRPPTAAAAEAAVADAAQRRRSPARRAASAWRPPPTSTAPGGRWSPPMRSPDDGLERLRALHGRRRPTIPGCVAVRLDLDDPASIEAAAGDDRSTRSARPTASCTTPGIAGVGCLEEMPDARRGSRCSRPTSSARSGSPGRCCRRCAPPAAAGSSWCRARAPCGACRGSAPTRRPRARSSAGRESLSYEIAPFGLGVTVLVAGSFKTDILELTQTYADPDGPYAALHHGLETTGRRFLRFARPPERFAPAVERALQDQRPFRRHSVGLDSRLLLVGSRLLPTALLQRVTTRAVGIPRPGALRGDPAQRARVTHHPEESEAIG